MTGLDTNILIRYYIDEPDADEKTLQQKESPVP
jgi:predicted nucleic-acid-binding protein